MKTETMIVAPDKKHRPASKRADDAVTCLGAAEPTSPLSPAVLKRRATYPPAPPATLTHDMIIFYYLPVTYRTLDRWISAGEFPGPDISKGRKTRLWFRVTVETWLTNQGGKAVA